MPESLELEIERLKGVSAVLKAKYETQSKKLEEQEKDLISIKTELQDTKDELLKAKNEHKTFVAQLDAGWKVLAILGGFALGLSYLAYNILSLRGMK